MKKKARLYFTHEVFNLRTCLLGMDRRKFVSAYLQLQSKFEIISLNFKFTESYSFKHMSNLFVLFAQSTKTELQNDR